MAGGRCNISNRKRTLFGGAGLIILTVFASLLALRIWGFYTNYPQETLACSENGLNSSSCLCFGESCYALQIADTPELRSKGLMFRDALGEKEGMLFIFEREEKWSFWMKNTLIPLDIIWLDSNLSVVEVITALPCREEFCPSYAPKRAARYVLELNAGTTAQEGISEGRAARLFLP
ncbi:MAG: DUF192 domain-containing protein [Candidatus Aenigmarchaeota archaeon]|nr:DUF192 domain-containing protein [Candidatus Aenigmarchaeota archaeon]